MELGTGMPQWRVSEPLLNLWLQDMPLFYQPSRGAALRFQLTYKSNPDSDASNEGQNSTVSSLGFNWFSPWHRYMSSTDVTTFKFFNGMGGTETVTNSGNADFRSHVTCTLDVSNNPVINYPSGAKDVFDYATPPDISGVVRYFPTTSTDEFGNVTQFTWQTNVSGVVFLSSITDVDTHTISFSYTNINGFLLLAQVSDPCGHTAKLQYDSAAGNPPNLTNIVDAANLTNGMTYSGTALASLITPYGTTTFTLMTSPTAVLVNELGLRNHLYVYSDTVDTSLTTNTLASFSPSTSPYANTLDMTDSNLRDSFYWGPRQYPLLPAAFITALTDPTSPTVVMADLFPTNILQARMRHWLLQTNTDTSTLLGQSLSLERASSPDGTNQGQITWYDYEGKPSGNPTVLGTNNLPKFEAWKLPNGESRFTYTVRNVLSNPTTIAETYDDSNGALQVRTSTLTYKANNIDLQTITNPLGWQVLSNAYNNFHQVTTNYDALNQKTLFTYDGNQRLTGIQTPSGLTITNIYGIDGYLATNTAVQIGRTDSYTWNNGLVATHTDPRGLVLAYTWDGLNRLIKTTFPGGTNDYITNTYNKLDLIQVVDRLGFTNRYAYNGFRQVTNVVDALNRTNNYFYCDCGALSSTSDPLNNTNSFFYDVSGRRVEALYADNYTVNYQFDLLSRLTNVFDSAGATTTNWFNNQGLIYAVTNSLGRVSFSQSDILDRVTNNINVNGVTITNTYDKLNRILTRSYPDLGFETFVYSTYGLITYTDQLGHATHFGYDAALRKIAETNAISEVTQFAYDPAGDLTNLTDAKLQHTVWHFDIFGMVTNKLDAANTIISSNAYDADWRMTNRWTFTKLNTYYFFDKVGNLTNVAYPTNTAILLAYDQDNRLTSMIDAAGTTSYGYNKVGQLLSEDGPWLSDTVNYTYNNRLRSGMSLQQPNADAWSQTYTYDAAKRLYNTASPAGSFGYAFDPTRKMDVGHLSLPNGSFITNIYESVGRLASTTLEDSTNGILNAHSCTYDLGGERTQQVFTQTNFENYTYDNIGQLTSALGKEAGGVTNRLLEQMRYGYDAAHNLNLRTNNALIQTFNVNSLNELTTVTHNITNALTVAGTTSAQATNVTVNGSTAALYRDATFAKDGFTAKNGFNTFTAIAGDSLGRHDTNSVTLNLPATVTYTYDTNGNLLSDGNRAFDYDDENQLIRVTVTNTWKSEFTYDGLMRMRKRKEFTWQGSVFVQTNEVRYVYDGKLVAQERDVNNLPTVTYTRGNDLSGTKQRAGGIGGLLARTDNATSQTAYYHADGNGNITALVNDQQVLVAKYVYDSFGFILSQSGPLADANKYRFSSKEYHQNSGMVYYLYRFYDPNLQRWLNRDPIGEVGGANLYTHTSNNAANLNDSYGHQNFYEREPFVETEPVELLQFGSSATYYQYPINRLTGWPEFTAEPLTTTITITRDPSQNPLTPLASLDMLLLENRLDSSESGEGTLVGILQPGPPIVPGTSSTMQGLFGMLSLSDRILFDDWLMWHQYCHDNDGRYLSFDMGPTHYWGTVQTTSMDLIMGGPPPGYPIYRNAPPPIVITVVPP